MSMVSEQVKKLRNGYDVYKTAGFPEAGELMKEAADTIETLSEKLRTVSIE